MSLSSMPFLLLLLISEMRERREERRGEKRREKENKECLGTTFIFCLMPKCIVADLIPSVSELMWQIRINKSDPSASYFGKMTRDIYWSRIEK